MSETLKIKSGDVIEFLAISWNEPEWDFDYPSVLLKPFVQYSPNGSAPDYLIEEAAIELCSEFSCEDEDVSEEFEWRSWKLSTLRKVAKDRLEGKDIWKTKIREVVKQKIRFYEKDGEMEFEIIETITA